jgi:hypothetical protein
MNIATLVRRCLKQFKALSALGSTDCLAIEQIDDGAGRFRIWAGNVSAHTTGRRSLQHRLRDSPELLSAVVTHLENLLVTLEDLTQLPFRPSEKDSSQPARLQADGVKDGISYDDDDSDAGFFRHVTFEATENGALEEASEIISCLLRLSMAFRNPAHNDQIRFAQTAGTRYYEPHDIRHVGSKFPPISLELNERCARSDPEIPYFRYREYYP